MALFQKKPQTTSPMPLYTIGSNKLVLIVGLGNIGKKFEKTRHNVGFYCLDAFAGAHEFAAWSEKTTLKSSLSVQALGSTRVILCKPTTMMNNSGQAVRAVMDYYEISLDNVIVIHDEIDVRFGQIRSRIGGGSAGHNGIKSLISHIGDEFGRIRIGIKPLEIDKPKSDTADYVLSKFNSAEQKQLKSLTNETTSLLTEFIYSGKLANDTRDFLG